MDYAKELRVRIKRVLNSMDDAGFDSLYISSPKNVLYLSGRESGRVLLTKKGCFLWVRGLYKELYSGLYGARNYPFEVSLYESNAVVKKIKSLRCRRMAVENVNLSYYNKIKSSFKCKTKPASIVEEERAVKTPYEIRVIQKSAKMASDCMKKAYGVIKPGVRELDAVADLERCLRRSGSETPSFHEGMLLSSGKRSADIHAHPTRSVIKKGLALVDLGARFGGYYSDMSRTIPVGKIVGKEKEYLDFVRNLELSAIDMIKPGMKASLVHDFIEKEIKKKGLEFHHSAGHGIGLDVHEKPSLSPDSEDVLKENMVFTIEPGIYLPGKFGIRFEDMVLLTKKGCKVLT